MLWWYYQNKWRKSREQYAEQAQRGTIATIASCEAHFFVARIYDTLSRGYERLCDTLEDANAVFDLELPAVCPWLIIAGQQLRESVEKGAQHSLKSGKDYERGVEDGTVHAAVKGRRALWQGEGGVHKDRWAFWELRLESLQSEGSLESAQVKHALEAMK